MPQEQQYNVTLGTKYVIKEKFYWMFGEVNPLSFLIQKFKEELIMPKYRRTYTSNGKVISTANQVIDFRLDTFPYSNANAQYLHIQTFASPLRIKLNDESAIHWIDADEDFLIDDINIDKFTILDAGIEYYYTAMSVE